MYHQWSGNGCVCTYMIKQEAGSRTKLVPFVCSDDTPPFFLTNQSHHSIWMWNKFSFCVIPYHIKANSNATLGCWDAVHISSGCMCCLLIRPLLVKPQRNDRHAHKHYVHSQWLTNSSKDTLDTPWNQAWPFVIKTIDCKPKVWPLFQCLFAK